MLVDNTRRHTDASRGWARHASRRIEKQELRKAKDDADLFLDVPVFTPASRRGWKNYSSFGDGRRPDAGRTAFRRGRFAAGGDPQRRHRPTAGVCHQSTGRRPSSRSGLTSSPASGVVPPGRPKAMRLFNNASSDLNDAVFRRSRRPDAVQLSQRWQLKVKGVKRVVPSRAMRPRSSPLRPTGHSGPFRHCRRHRAVRAIKVGIIGARPVGFSKTTPRCVIFSPKPSNSQACKTYRSLRQVVAETPQSAFGRAAVQCFKRMRLDEQLDHDVG